MKSEHVIDFKTQQDFSDLSGDHNPLHEDIEFLAEMRKEFATFNADIARIMRFHRFVIIGSLAALMTVFSVLTPLLN